MRLVFPLIGSRRDKGQLLRLLVESVLFLISLTCPIIQSTPGGDLFPLRVFVCNILATAIAYVIERSNLVDERCENTVK